MPPDIKLFFLLNDLAGQSRIVDTIVVFFASYLQYFFLATLVVFVFFSKDAKREKLRIFWVTVASIVVARLGVTELIRFFYHRPRPFVTHHVHQLLPENGWSFPSGHSAFFFAMATAVFLYNRKWGAWFFLGAIVMNISRIIAGVHYPSDILGGAVVGVVVSCLVFSFLRNVHVKSAART